MTKTQQNYWNFRTRLCCFPWWLLGCSGWLLGCSGWLLGCSGWLLGCYGWLLGCSRWLLGCSGWLLGCCKKYKNKTLFKILTLSPAVFFFYCIIFDHFHTTFMAPWIICCMNIWTCNMSKENRNSFIKTLILASFHKKSNFLNNGLFYQRHGSDSER